MNSIDPTRPLECPFCNFAGDAVIKLERRDEAPGSPNVDAFYIICHKCGAAGPLELTSHDAIWQWNQAPRRRLLGG